MNREVHVRFCERRRVQLPPATHLYLKAGPETEHIAVLIVIGVREDGHKELLAMRKGIGSLPRVGATCCAI